MTTAMSLGLLFIAKMADNALSTVKTIMIQRNRSLLAGVAIALSSFLDHAQCGFSRQPADNDDGSGGQWFWLLFGQPHQ